MALARRRRFIVAASTLVLTSPFVWAQQPGRIRRVGFMAQIVRPDPIDAHFFGALPKGLRDLGYIEGKNLTMDWRFADGDVGRLPRLAADLVQAKPDVIVTAGTLSAVAMRKATDTIPVVFGNVSDPVASGLVKSLGRPGTNMTGLASLATDINPKVMELMLEAVPGISRLAVLINPLQPAHSHVASGLEAAAEKRGIQFKTAKAATPAEIESAFATIARERAQGVILPLEGLFIQQRRQIVDLSVKYRLPIASGDNEIAKAGALISYGADQNAMFRRIAAYVDRILKGAKPEDLPVEQPTTFDLAINMKTARALGLTISQLVLLRANRVIE